MQGCEERFFLCWVAQVGSPRLGRPGWVAQGAIDGTLRRLVPRTRGEAMAPLGNLPHREKLPADDAGPDERGRPGRGESAAGGPGAGERGPEPADRGAAMPNGSSHAPSLSWWLVTVLTSVLLGSGSGYVAMSSGHAARIAVLES